jgi:hypothetical protein
MYLLQIISPLLIKKNHIMKKNTSFITIILIMALSIIGCKKDEKQTKDYTPFLNNKVWVGQFKYADKPLQPASIEFKESGQFNWHALLEEITGTWKIENGELTVNFPNGSGFKANISDDHKLTNIRNYPANDFMMDNAMLNEATDPVLDNTTWTASNIIIKFKPGNLADLELGSGSLIYQNLPYVLKGKSLHFSPLADYKWFVVINSATSMNGANQFSPDPTIYTFQLAKQ